AKAVAYEGAGTIEFIADASDGLKPDRIWFMEMNTRLQVEHPVTEEITGQDLVEWQLRVASGEPLPRRQDELAINGWAMEARLYAEDPAKGFLPTSGEIHHLPFDVTMRVDTGYDWSEVPPYYDPMLAKLIVRRRTREAAIDHLLSELRGSVIGPIKTNASFIYRALEHPDFRNGGVDTGFLERHSENLTEERALSEAARDMAADYFVGLRQQWDSQFASRDVWTDTRGFRLNRQSSTDLRLVVDGKPEPGRFNQTFAPDNNRRLPDHAYFDGETVWLNESGQTYQVTVERHGGGHSHHAHDGDILSPMPGKIIAVEVAQGDTVTKGQKLLTLEAMKMEHTLTAPFDGVVAELSATPGAQVQVEALLARIEASGD
ncbi:MAG: methylcrotonoyl-CoA carboxylase, partial [Novosphingobium sp.]|nr:methylcrotonoyl-CoA carboxylase [Novosphingobium sp.]